MKKAIVSLFLTLAILAAPGASFAQSEGKAPAAPVDTTLLVYDLLFVRPIALAAIVAGAALYIPAAALTLLAGKDLAPLTEPLLIRPYDFGIARPLGEFD
ncbi:MAG: hypothetical protein V3V62_00980 [bacterium]